MTYTATVVGLWIIAGLVVLVAYCDGRRIYVPLLTPAWRAIYRPVYRAWRATWGGLKAGFGLAGRSNGEKP